MEKKNFFVTIILAIMICLPAAQAFTVDLVDISINQSGDASVQMNYTLNPVELGVYHVASMVMDTKSVAQERLEQTFHKDVTVHNLNPDSAQYNVYDFAQIDNGTYITPEFRSRSSRK
jgi:hypothetical protein